MGDRTHVTLILDRENYLKIKDESWFDHPEIANDIGMALPGRLGSGSRSLTDSDPKVALDYDEVNYGDLDFLVHLKDRGMAFTSSWGSGDNYGAGETTCRFNSEGECQLLHLPESEANPPLVELMKLIDAPNQLASYVKQYHEKHTPWPFKNQVEYGGFFQVRQLLQPNKD